VIVILALCGALALGMGYAVAETSTTQSSIRAAESFEGLWTKTKEECLDEDGPNSRTMIDLRNVVSGKPTPIFDQYENHCLIERKSVAGNDATLSVICFEFWENFTKRIEGTKATIKLSPGPNGGLMIDGKKYQYCAKQPTQSNVASNARRNASSAAIADAQRPSSETYEQGRVWEEQIKYGACTRLRDRLTDSSSDVAECRRMSSQQPLCKSYSGFANVWFDMASV
jgi:hypothetical protein